MKEKVSAPCYTFCLCFNLFINADEAKMSSCDTAVKINVTSWQIQAGCVIAGAYSSRNRYSCTLLQQQEVTKTTHNSTHSLYGTDCWAGREEERRILKFYFSAWGARIFRALRHAAFLPWAFSAGHLSCSVLSCPVLPCLYPVLPWPALPLSLSMSFPVLSLYLSMSLSCPALSCPVQLFISLSCLVLLSLVLPLSCPALSCPVLICPALSCPALSYPALSCSVLSCPAPLCPVLS